MPRLSSSALQFIGHLFYFGSLYLLNNPFIQMPPSVKFSSFATCLVLGMLISNWNDHRAIPNSFVIILSFLVLYGLATLRMNDLNYPKYEAVAVLVYQMAILSIISFTSSVLMLRNFSVKMMTRALLFASVPCGIWICYNFSELTDYRLSKTFALGNLSYNDYQTTSAMLAIGSLCALREIELRRIWKKESLAGCIVFLLFGFFILQGLARGEAIAYVASVAFYMAPRVTLLVVPFSYSILSIATLAYHTPLTERMRDVLEGDYGSRDQLLMRSAYLLDAEPSTILVGGGMNYFQYYWNFPLGKYPHNVLVEALVTGGIPLLALLLVVYVLSLVRPLLQVMRNNASADERIALSLALFLLLISLKSGSLLSFWMLSTFTSLFLYCYQGSNSNLSSKGTRV